MQLSLYIYKTPLFCRGKKSGAHFMIVKYSFRMTLARSLKPPWFAGKNWCSRKTFVEGKAETLHFPKFNRRQNICIIHWLSMAISIFWPIYWNNFCFSCITNMKLSELLAYSQKLSIGDAQGYALTAACMKLTNLLKMLRYLIMA